MFSHTPFGSNIQYSFRLIRKLSACLRQASEELRRLVISGRMISLLTHRTHRCQKWSVASRLIAPAIRKARSWTLKSQKDAHFWLSHAHPIVDLKSSAPRLHIEGYAHPCPPQAHPELLPTHSASSESYEVWSMRERPHKALFDKDQRDSLLDHSLQSR